jgi:hypothetical protein
MKRSVASTMRSRIASWSTPSSAAQATGSSMPQLQLDALGQRLDLPLLGVAPRRHEVVHEVLHDLMAHVGDDLVHVLASMISRRWREDHLALVVHHVVELEELLADVEVAPLDLGLRRARGSC